MPGLPPTYGDNAALMEAMGYTSVPSATIHQQIPQMSAVRIYIIDIFG